MNGINKNAKYYDHALNSAPDAAVAITRARKKVKEEGRAYMVIACWPGKEKEPFYWDGCYYDALGLARSLHFSRAEVRLISPSGRDVDIENARY